MFEDKLPENQVSSEPVTNTVDAIDTSQHQDSVPAKEPTKQKAINPFTKKEIAEDTPQPDEDTAIDNTDHGKKQVATKEAKTPLEQKDEVIKREKIKRQEIKKQKQELEQELQDAIRAKDEISQKLIEREARELEKKERMLNKEKWNETSRDKVKDFNAYKESVEYYVPKFIQRPEIERLVRSSSNPHGVLEVLINYMDNNGIHVDTIVNEKYVSDRQLALMIREIDRGLRLSMDTRDTELMHEAKKEVPKAIVANTSKDNMAPELSTKASRKEALLHARRYGTQGVQFND